MKEIKKSTLIMQELDIIHLKTDGLSQLIH